MNGWGGWWVYGYMDVFVGRQQGWEDSGWVSGYMYVLVDVGWVGWQMGRCIDMWMDGWMNRCRLVEWVSGWLYRWMDRWVNSWIEDKLELLFFELLWKISFISFF